MRTAFGSEFPKSTRDEAAGVCETLHDAQVIINIKEARKQRPLKRLEKAHQKNEGPGIQCPVGIGTTNPRLLDEGLCFQDRQIPVGYGSTCRSGEADLLQVGFVPIAAIV